MAVTVENITKYYGKQCVLDNVSFSLQEGEITGFIGANGAGKTTTMDIITGYQNHWQGEVTVYNQNIRIAPIASKKLIGYLPEHNPLEYNLYVKEYLNYVASIYLHRKQINEAVNEVIKQVGLEKEQHKKIGMLSKGYKQRVGLAQALVHRPKVLILDEPTTGLDPEQLDEIRSLIRDISKDKVVLFSTHIMQEAEALCDRVLMLKKGQLIKDFRTKNTDTQYSKKQKVRIAFSSATSLPTLPFASRMERVSDSEYIIFGNEGEDIRSKLFHYSKANNLSLIHLAEEQNDFTKTIKSYLQSE